MHGLSFNCTDRVHPGTSVVTKLEWVFSRTSKMILLENKVSNSGIPKSKYIKQEQWPNIAYRFNEILNMSNKI